jgi:hypothetical protein
MMKDAFVESHRARALTVAAVLFMVVGVVDAGYGALTERWLTFSVGALFFTCAVLMFKTVRRKRE